VQPALDFLQLLHAWVVRRFLPFDVDSGEYLGGRAGMATLLCGWGAIAGLVAPGFPGCPDCPGQIDELVPGANVAGW
jgi:hypothetical protein